MLPSCFPARPCLLRVRCQEILDGLRSRLTSPHFVQSSTLGQEDDNDNIPRYFEIGRVLLRDLFSDRSVSVKTDWLATDALRTARKLDCGDGPSNPVVLTTLYVTPGGNLSLIVGAMTQLTVIGNFSDGSTQNLTGIANWTSTNNMGVMISQSGLVTALATGVAMVSASYTSPGGTLVASAPIQITVSP